MWDLLYYINKWWELGERNKKKFSSFVNVEFEEEYKNVIFIGINSDN